MASLYITEFGPQARDSNNNLIPMAQGMPLAQQKITIGGASVASAAFGANTAIVRLQSDAVCSVVFALAPVATDAMMRIATDSPEYFGVPMGGSFKVAVITNT